MLIGFDGERMERWKKPLLPQRLMVRNVRMLVLPSKMVKKVLEP